MGPAFVQCPLTTCPSPPVGKKAYGSSRMSVKAAATWWFSIGLASLYSRASGSLERTRKSLLTPLQVTAQGRRGLMQGGQ